MTQMDTDQNERMHERVTRRSFPGRLRARIEHELQGLTYPNAHW
jgi:hypothetical protein